MLKAAGYKMHVEGRIGMARSLERGRSKGSTPLVIWLELPGKSCQGCTSSDTEGKRGFHNSTRGMAGLMVKSGTGCELGRKQAVENKMGLRGHAHGFAGYECHVCQKTTCTHTFAFTHRHTIE